MKILHGSSYWFKNKKDFKPNDIDYIVIQKSDKVFEHKHPKEKICWFVWNDDREQVLKYLHKSYDYLSVASITAKEFVEHFNINIEEVIQIILKFIDAFKVSKYAYYIPIFEHIITYKSLDIPQNVINTAYKIYKNKKIR